MEPLKPNSFGGIFNKRKNNFTLPMAPMIDMIFLLLIFFLVCTKYKSDIAFLPFNLPQARADQAPLIQTEPLIIHINQQNEICVVRFGPDTAVTIGQTNTDKDLAALIDQLNTVLRSQKRYVSDPVEIICGDEVVWDYVAKIYNLLYGAGLTDITFCVNEPKQ